MYQLPGCLGVETSSDGTEFSTRDSALRALTAKSTYTVEPLQEVESNAKASHQRKFSSNYLDGKYNNKNVKMLCISLKWLLLFSLKV